MYHKVDAFKSELGFYTTFSEVCCFENTHNSKDLLLRNTENNKIQMGYSSILLH